MKEKNRSKQRMGKSEKNDESANPRHEPTTEQEQNNNDEKFHNYY